MVIFARILKAARCAASSLFADATLAMRRIPAMRDWLEATGLFAVFLLIAAAIGTLSGLITIPVALNWTELLPVAFIAFFIPALGEELVFRVWMQGQSRSPTRVTIALAVFVLWHPIQVLLGLPMARPAFLDPAFLLLVGLLGMVCTISWQRSASIWPAVIMHWLAVVGWKAFTS